jgi:hypothetical protein
MKDSDFFKEFEFCCGRMAANITLENNRKRGQVVMYDPSVREYSVCVINQRNAISPINYCPYCGKKLPSELGDDWIEVIKSEFGKDFFCEDDAEWFEKELPPEFKTDEWWKKRGL